MHEGKTYCPDVSQRGRQNGNDGADALAVTGAAMHAIQEGERTNYQSRLLPVQRVQRMMVEIMQERAARQRQLHAPASAEMGRR